MSLAMAAAFHGRPQTLAVVALAGANLLATPFGGPSALDWAEVRPRFMTR